VRFLPAPRPRPFVSLTRIPNTDAGAERGRALGFGVARFLLIRAADAAAAAQSQADADAAAAAQAAVDYAARAAASAYDAQVAADAAAQAALLAGDDDDDDDDSDDDDGYGGSIFNDYRLLSGSTAASIQSSANGFLAGSSSNSFQVPLTASDVTNLFGSGSGSLISSPVDLGSGPGGDPATSAIAPNSAGGLASTNSNGLWVPNGLNDLLHGQPVLPGLPTAVPGGTLVVNVNPQPDIGGSGDRSGMRLTATYYNNSNQTYNWTQVVTTDTLPHPGGTTPYSDSLPGAVAPGANQRRAARGRRLRAVIEPSRYGTCGVALGGIGSKSLYANYCARATCFPV
jgi:hypothetical protein